MTERKPLLYGYDGNPIDNNDTTIHEEVSQSNQSGSNSKSPQESSTSPPVVAIGGPPKGGHGKDVLSLLIAAATAAATIVYAIYAGHQWKVMKDQLTQMEGGSKQSERLITETHTLVENAGKQASKTEALANSSSEQATQLKSMVRAADASVKIANQELVANRDTFRAANRAYVGVKDVTINNPLKLNDTQTKIVPGWNILDVEIVNDGRTPARRPRTWGAATITSELLGNDNPSYPVSAERQVLRFTGKDMISGTSDFLKPAGNISVAEFRDIFLPANPNDIRIRQHLKIVPKLYFMAFGVIQYEDIFEVTHITKWCVFYDISQNDIGYCQAHNTIE